MDINKAFELWRNGKLHECSIGVLRAMSAGSVVFIQNHFSNAKDLKEAIDDEIRRKEAAEAEERAASRYREKIEIKIGDNYTAVQVGAMGPHAHAHDVTLHQANTGELAQIDLRKLADELATLRGAMRRSAVEPVHDIAVGQIAAAEVAAKKGDISSVVHQLKSAGKWAFDIATKIGVSVASEAIKKSMGL